MLWIYVYVTCVIILGIFFLLTVYSSYEFPDQFENIEIVGLLICAPVVLIILLFVGLKELICYIAPKIYYFSRFWNKQTVGIMITDIRWVYAINGKLQQDKTPVVHRMRDNGEMIYAGLGFYSNEPTVMVYPIIGGVVSKWDEMNFMVKSFLKESGQFFSFKTFYNIAIPVVTTESERRALLYSFSPQKVKLILIPNVISSIIDESNFGMIYLAHSFTEITIVKNGSVQAFTFENIGLEDLSKSIIKGVNPSLRTCTYTMRRALESLMNGLDFKLCGPDNNTHLPLEVTLTMTDLIKYSAHWISSIRKMFTKLPMSDFKWYAISDYGQLNIIATLFSEECSLKIHPINDSQERIAKELSIMNPPNYNS